MLIGGLWFALRPLSQADGRFFFLPVRWAMWLDFNDWAVNFAAFGLFAWLTMRLFGGDHPTRVAAVVLPCFAAGIGIIEYLQGGIPGRLVDVTDMVAGVAGTAAGVIIAAVLEVKKRGMKAEG